MSDTVVCPNCGREYEPEYDDISDAPPMSIGVEQHKTGICSDECWDDFLGVNPDDDPDDLDPEELFGAPHPMGGNDE